MLEWTLVLWRAANVGLCDVQYYENSYLGKGFYINIIIIIIMRLYILYVTVLHRCIITSLRLSVFFIVPIVPFIPPCS